MKYVDSVLKYIDLNKYAIELAQKWSPSNQRKMEILLELQSQFDDLKGVKDRWGNVRFISADANKYVEEIDLEHQSIDFDGMPIEVWPFIYWDLRGTKLYCDPACFIVGDKNTDGFGYNAREGWLEKMQEAQISRSVIMKVKDYLEKHPPINYKDIEDD